MLSVSPILRLALFLYVRRKLFLHKDCPICGMRSAILTLLAYHLQSHHHHQRQIININTNWIFTIWKCVKTEFFFFAEVPHYLKNKFKYRRKKYLVSPSLPKIILPSSTSFQLNPTPASLVLDFQFFLESTANFNYVCSCFLKPCCWIS